MLFIMIFEISEFLSQNCLTYFLMGFRGVVYMLLFNGFSECCS